MLNLFKRKKVEVAPPTLPFKRRVQVLEPGKLYILIGNNKDNISVAKFSHYHTYHGKPFELPIFTDIKTGEESFALCKTMFYTEQRLIALSKLTWQEVVALSYQNDYDYVVDNDAPTKDEYIDPQLNCENILKAIQELNA